MEILESAKSVVGSSSVPAHEQIRVWIVNAVASGALSAGSQLPSERDLADALGVSRMTLRQALSRLVGNGTLLKQPRGGTFVRADTVTRELSNLEGLTVQIARANRVAHSQVLSAGTHPADEAEADGLEVSLGTPVHRVERIRFADDTPVGLEQSAFPAEMLPDLLSRDLDGSLYAVLAEHGHRPVRAIERISPVLADAELAERLEVEVGLPLQVVERQAFAATGHAIELSRDVFVPAEVSFVVTSAFD